MPAGEALQIVVADQRVWSLTANRAKAKIERAYRKVLFLAILGAILATGGAQVYAWNQVVAEILGYSGGATLLILAVIRQRNLGTESFRVWTLSRSASEAFKGEIYRYRAGVAPYSGDDASIILLDRREQILGKVQSAQAERAETPMPIAKSDILDAAGYIEERLSGSRGQIPYYHSRSQSYAEARHRVRGIETFLEILGALLCAAVTFAHLQSLGAWVAVITTISGALAAHVSAQRYDQLAISFRTTADRLTGVLARWKAIKPQLVGDLIEKCERIITEENQSWLAGADEVRPTSVAHAK